MSAHPILSSVRELLIDQAVDLNGGDTSAHHNVEYVRGQAELIANTTGAFADDDLGIEAPTVIYEMILARLDAEACKDNPDRTGHQVSDGSCDLCGAKNFG